MADAQNEAQSNERGPLSIFRWPNRNKWNPLFFPFHTICHSLNFPLFAPILSILFAFKQFKYLIWSGEIKRSEENNGRRMKSTRKTFNAIFINMFADGNFFSPIFLFACVSFSCWSFCRSAQVFATNHKQFAMVPTDFVGYKVFRLYGIRKVNSVERKANCVRCDWLSVCQLCHIRWVNNMKNNVMIMRNNIHINSLSKLRKFLHFDKKWMADKPWSLRQFLFANRFQTHWSAWVSSTENDD